MKRNRRPTIIIAAAAGAAALMLASACSSSGSSTAATGTSTGGTSAAGGTGSVPAGSAIRVGLLCDCTGPYSSNYLFEADAGNAWAQSVNAAGGINGHPVKLYTMDAAGDPTTALQDVKQLVQQDKIIALDDVSTTSTAWAAYITSQGVPVVGGNVSEAPFYTNPDFFADGSSLPVNLVGDMLQMQKLGLKHFGMMYCAEAPVCATQGALASDAAKAVPGITVSSEKVAATSPTYTAPCVAFKSTGVDALFTGVPAQEGLRVIDSCKTLGYTPKPTVQVTVTGHNWLSDPNVNGTIIIAPNANFADSSVPGVKAFQDAMQKYYPNDLTQPEYGGTTLVPWIAGELFEAAAKAAGIGPNSTGANVKTGLYALKNETLDGLIGPVTYTPGKVTFPTCNFVLSIENGTFTSPQGGGAQCLTTDQLNTLNTALGAS
jgi:branched-chain amino acid transport system substrate-binding protein